MDELLAGAIDLHCHIDFEFSARHFRKPVPESVWLPEAEAAGMRGAVLKSHWWPTAAVVPYLRQLYQGPVELWSSITLNPVVGGPELWAVETAVALGARVVFLPTWGSSGDHANRGFNVRLGDTFETFEPAQLPAITFLDEQGRLSERGQELLRYCHQHDLTLATGHLAWRDSLAFAEAAHGRGYRRLILSHPLSPSVQAPLAAVRRATELGAWAELCGTNLEPGRTTPAEAVAWLREVGPERVVLSTDYFRTNHPSPPALLRRMLTELLEAGAPRELLRRAVVEQPARALGLAE